MYSDAPRRRLVLEHYTNAGVLDRVMEGPRPAALYAAAIERLLLTRLDHAAYPGRELARALRAMETGEPYVQDRAPGEMGEPQAALAPRGCGTACTPESTDEQHELCTDNAR